MSTKRKPGRPRGTTKPGTVGVRIAIRITDEQRAKLDRLPGAAIPEKIRRLLDSLE